MNTHRYDLKWPNILYLIRHGQSERNVRKDLAKAAGRETVWSEGVRDQDTPLTSLGVLQALSVGVELRKHHPEKEGYPVTAGTLTFQVSNDNVNWFPIQGGIPYSYGTNTSWASVLDPDGRVSRRPIDTIFTSPYLRARQTTSKITEGLGYSPKVVVEERIRELEFGILDGLTPEGIRVKYPEEVERRKKEGKYYYRPPGGENRPDLNLRIHSFIDTLNRDYVGDNVVISCHSVVVLAFRHLLERWDETSYLLVDKEQDVKNASVTTYVRENNKIRLKAYNETHYD